MAFYKIPGLGTVHIKMSGKGAQAAPCHVCGNISSSLCDHRGRDGKTCDAPMCALHRGAHVLGKDRDYCRHHAPAHAHETAAAAAVLPLEGE